MLRLMLRCKSRKLLILKQCYMLRFFQVQIEVQYILGKPHTLFLKKHNFITLPIFSLVTP
jgi:hypothetical protein